MHKIKGIIYLITAAIYLVCGIISCCSYKSLWWKSRERKQNPDATGPSEKYIKDRKMGGIVLFVLTAISVVMGIVQLSIAHTDGKPLTLDGKDMKFPCKYEDIQAMGYELVEGQKIEELKGMKNGFVRYGEDYKVVNDKGQVFQIRFENNTPDIKLATDCYIYKMTFEYEDPYNMYEDMSNNTYLYQSQYEELGFSQEEIDESKEKLDQMASDFEERNKAMNSPQITLDNGVSSRMDEKSVEEIMGKGIDAGGYGQMYQKNKIYVMEYGDQHMVISITYSVKGTKSQIQKISIEY